MKKRVIFVISLVALSVVLAACNNGKWIKSNSIDYSKYDLSDYSAEITGYSDSIPESINYGTLSSLYDANAYTNIAPEAEIKIRIGDKTITANFTQTYNRPNNYFPSYMYKANDDSCSFSVDEKGRIIQYLNHDLGKDAEEPLSNEEYIDIAKGIIESLFGDDEIEWSLFDVEITKDANYKGNYKLLFEKYLNGKKTAESITIKLAYSGEVISFYSDMLGRIPENLDLSLLEEGTARVSVYNKLDEIYNGLSNETKEKYKIEYKVAEPIISVQADGTPCYIYKAEVKFDPINNKSEYVDAVTVIVTPSK